MRGKKHGSQTDAHGSQQTEAEFNFGYFYRTIEEHINTFAAQAGCPYSVADIALRVGDALRAKAAQVREALGDSELLLEVRQDGTAAGLRRTVSSDEALHVRPRAKRTLRAKALKAISRAQKARWAKYHASKDAAAGMGRGHPKNGVHWTQTPKGRAHMRKTAASRFHRSIKRNNTEYSKSAKSFWGKMSPAQRSAEVRRRKLVHLGKAASNKVVKIKTASTLVPDGYWQKETGRLLRNGPRSREQVRTSLLRHYPAKGNAVTVALARMKRDRLISEADGMLSAQSSLNGAAATA